MMYVLNQDGTPRPTDDVHEWAKMIESRERIVARDVVGNITVSTVFLGIDHNFGSGPPLLWETMVFGGHDDENQERYDSLDAAKEGHQRILRRATARLVNIKRGDVG